MIVGLTWLIKSRQTEFSIYSTKCMATTKDLVAERSNRKDTKKIRKTSKLNWIKINK